LLNEPEFGYDWAIEAKEKLNAFILSDNHPKLIDYKNLGKSVALAIPSPDHYLLLLYTLALKTQKDQVSLFNDKALMCSLTMISVMIN